jgi:putative hemolysin
MKQNIETSLAAVQVAMAMLSITAAAIGGIGAADYLKRFFVEYYGFSHGSAEFFAVITVAIPLTCITTLFGELVPKVFALRNKEWVCLQLSRSMRVFCISIWPAVWLFETAVHTMIAWSERQWRPWADPRSKLESVELLELRAQAASARAKRLIGEREEGIILSAARFSTRKIREIMLPAENISSLDAGSTLAEALVVAHLEMHTRFPVAERPGDPASILGYVNFKDIVALMRLSPHDASLRAIVRPLPSLDADLLLTTCLERLIHEHAHIALIRDTAGKVVGLITLEDLMEELVGDIQDEYDRLPIHATPAGNDWIVGGGLSLTRLKEITGLDLLADMPPISPEIPPGLISEGGVRTISDWVIAVTQGHFHSGDVFERFGIRLLVRKVRRLKVFEAQIGRLNQL